MSYFDKDLPAHPAARRAAGKRKGGAATAEKGILSAGNGALAEVSDSAARSDLFSYYDTLSARSARYTKAEEQRVCADDVDGACVDDVDGDVQIDVQIDGRISDRQTDRQTERHTNSAGQGHLAAWKTVGSAAREAGADVGCAAARLRTESCGENGAVPPGCTGLKVALAGTDAGGLRVPGTTSHGGGKQAALEEWGQRDRGAETQREARGEASEIEAAEGRREAQRAGWETLALKYTVKLPFTFHSLAGPQLHTCSLRPRVTRLFELGVTLRTSYAQTKSDLIVQRLLGQLYQP
eukprot:1163027-Rhodomonas_salina.1